MKIQHLIIFIFSFNLYAQNFSSFKISDVLLNKALNTELDPDDVRNHSNVYDQITKHYQTTYDSYGRSLSNSAINNGLFGGTNMIGWRHANEFSNFKVVFNRSIAPVLEIESHGYIVNDSMIIEIDAAKFLKQLADEDLIKITEKNLLAYAGITFRRTMRYNHFASSLEDGLQKDYDKLFMMSKFFKSNMFNDLVEYDFLTKEDAYTLSAGALITAPAGTYLSVAAGAYGDIVSKSKVTIQRLGRDDVKDPGEVIRLGVEDAKSISVGANATLLADLFGLLRLTLLSYDFEYRYTKTYKTYLSLFDTDITNSLKITEVDKILKFKNYDSLVLAENIKSKEIREDENRTSKWIALLWSGIKKSTTKMSEIFKDDKVYKFFTHNFEKLTYKENLLSKVLVTLWGKLVGYNQLAARTYVDSSTVSINYESEYNVLDTKMDFNIFDKNVLSIEMGNNFRINEDKKSKKNEVKDKIFEKINSRTDSSQKYSTILDEYELNAPSEFVSLLTMDNKNIEQFMMVDSKEVFTVIKESCTTKSKGIFSLFRSLFNGCKYKSYRDYNRFLKEWTTVNYDKKVYDNCSRKYKYRFLFNSYKKRQLIQSCMEINYKIVTDYKDRNFPLWRFKDVANNLNSNLKSLKSLEGLFGKFNNKGYVQVNINNKTTYKNYFNEGVEKFNIITNFKIENNLRSPASID